MTDRKSRHDLKLWLDACAKASFTYYPITIGACNLNAAMARVDELIQWVHDRNYAFYDEKTGRRQEVQTGDWSAIYFALSAVREKFPRDTIDSRDVAIETAYSMYIDRQQTNLKKRRVSP